MNQHTKTNVDIYDTKFINFIRQLLRKGRLVESYIETIVGDPANMKIFLQALTSAAFNPEYNYEVYEFVGDAAGSNFLAFYFLNKFPQLNSPSGVQILSRLKIKFGSKSSYSKIAGGLGFGQFIQATDIELTTNKNKLLEDCLEAMIGAIILVINGYENVNHGLGNDVGYFLLENAFDALKISTKYEDIVDATTRLKELLDYINIIPTTTSEQTQNDANQIIHKVSISLTISVTAIQLKFPAAANRAKGDYIFQNQILGSSSSFKKKDAIEAASVQALAALADKGIRKEVPQAYKLLGVSPR